MFYGLNDNNEKIHIDKVLPGENYICPACNGSLIKKMGPRVAHHFAHKKAECDPWYHDNKGEWHKKMQSYFRPEQCEVKIEDSEGNFHIADVFIEGKKKNIIIEFQHSPISQQEFDERNKFYTNNGCKLSSEGYYVQNAVIWVFDFRDKRMFIDIGYDTYFTDDKMDKAYNNKMCREWADLSGRYYIEKNILTQHETSLCKDMYANIIWKNPTKIFSNIGSNVFVFFDVRQRRYLKRIEEWNGRSRIKWNFLGEEGNILFSDILNEFLIFVSYKDPKMISKENNKNYINYQLKFLSGEIVGRIFSYDDFFNYYTNI